MINVYTDGSKTASGVSAAAIVVTANTFIDYKVEILPTEYTTTGAELYAALIGLRLVDENFTGRARVNLVCDCKAVVEGIRNLLVTDTEPKSIYREAWAEIHKLCRKHDVHVVKVRAHMEDTSYNSLCDYSARAVIRK